MYTRLIVIKESWEQATTGVWAIQCSSLERLEDVNINELYEIVSNYYYSYDEDEKYYVENIENAITTYEEENGVNVRELSYNDQVGYLTDITVIDPQKYGEE